LATVRRESIAETERSGASEIAYSLDELIYVIEWCGFEVESVQLSPSPPSRTAIRGLARAALRWSRIDGLVSSPTRILVARPKAKGA
jgi:hypothetical protein